MLLFTLTMLGGAALAPGESGLKFENARFTYGPLGQPRKKDEKFLPRDRLYLCATVKGLTVGKNGVVEYDLSFEVTKKGVEKPLTSQEPLPQEQLNWLGGGDVPVMADWVIPAGNDAAGEYTMKLTCTDRATKKSVTHTQTFTVDKVAFGFIQTYLVGAVALVGQKAGLQYALTGFDFDKKTNKTNVTVTIRVLDDKDKPTFEKPRKETFEREYDDAPGVMAFNPMLIELNRPGKYKVEVSATCNVSKKTAREVFDLTVVELK